MKIVIPVKTSGENPALAPLFGKAKWFAFVEDNKVTVEKNPAEDGQAVIHWLIDQNVDVIIFQEMGTTPYELIRSQSDIKLYHAGFERVLLHDILQRYQEGSLAETDRATMAEIIAHHEGKHSHGGGHHGHHHHH